MAKQTFTTGQVLTAAQMTSLQQTAMLGGAASAKVASYVLVAADAGDAITMSNAGATTITVNTGLFAAGDIVTIINLGAGVCTITAGTATVSTSGSLALAQNQGGVLRFTSASAAIFFQFATPASGDIEGVTAGTGISGGGTSGTVTITNSMATEITAKGDLIVGTGSATFDNLPVGSNSQILVADSTASTGLKWATPASGGGMTLLSTTSLTGAATITISSISQSYTNLYILITGLTVTTGTYTLKLKPNASTANNYTSLAGATASSGNPDYISPGFAGHSASSAVNDYALVIYNYTDTAARKPFHLVGIAKMASQIEPLGVSNFGATNLTAAISSFELNNDSGGNFTAGTVKIYGVN
jgi:hypothetical protein